MRKLIDEVYSHSNHFNLIRLVAAVLVIYSHSFALSTGDGLSEPMRVSWGITFGSIAVDVFFVVSGLLVTASLVRRKSIVEFSLARFFRIIPGLAVVVGLTVFIVGPIFTTALLEEYFGDAGTWIYVLRNLILVGDVKYTLIGVFESTPWSGVNGSLWTLPFEVRCYAGLLLLWIVCRDQWKFSACIVVATLIFLGLHLSFMSNVSIEASPFRLYYMFSAGCLCFVVRKWLPLSNVLAAVVLLAIGLGSFYYKPVFSIVYSLVLPYLVVWVAYLPAGTIGRLSRTGDISYGTYVYGWPVQQIVVSVFPGLTSLALFFISLPCVLVLAVLSWRLIESPAIKYGKSDFVRKIRHIGVMPWQSRRT